MKLETNGVMTLKNINLLNNDFLGKITTLEQEVNVLQQTLGNATQDIGENSANGDFAFSAESGTVRIGTGVAGTSNEYSRGDHEHPLQVSDVLPSKDTSVGTVGQASSYARSDHQHPIQTVNTIPVCDSADGSYGTVDSYARNDHSHPINVQTNASIIPIVNGIGNNGTLSDQWNIAVPDTGEFRIGLGAYVVQANKGLVISADGNTLSFNGSVIAGTGATNGASNGSVNYSAGNPILWGLNSVDTNGGFYSDGPKIYWRAKPVTLGAVPP
ncbi:MAG: hypothetical protein EZS28_023483 [Streblomastix strix]|uniref:Uncharacterized protein n=1 Tax=Streblomastix strix TaxID=222440 RepID=A0A5J4VEG4_9EUKA|nr:MAG: hypothetical protein EZS28_023483 [Streblomastix strix]